jgi:hypothetical protein
MAAKNDPRVPCPERPLTTNEAAVLLWLLDHAPVRDVTDYRVRPLEDLRVVRICSCGCASLFLAPNTHPGHPDMIADAMAVYPDGHQANLILWGQQGEITWLEVNDYAADDSHRVPEVANLRTYEQWGEERLK